MKLSGWPLEPSARRSAALAVLTCLAFFPHLAFGAQGDIHHLAGGGLGDGAQATNAIVNPLDVAMDAFGDLVIADDSRVRKIEATGRITTIAGTGRGGFSGDGGPATSGQVSRTSGLTFLGSGDLIIADSHNHRLRKVDSRGVISTIAGDGFGEGYAAGGRFQGDGGPASQASLNNPNGLASDAAGNIYVADQRNDRVRKISPAGVITTIAGGGPSIECPEPAVCPHGDGGPATLASLDGPQGVAVGDDGIYIADTGHNRIRRVDSLGNISTVAGLTSGIYKSGMPALASRIYQPADISTTTGGDLFVSHWGHNGGLISRIDSSGFIWTVAGGGNRLGDDIPAYEALLHRGGLFAFKNDAGESEVLLAELHAYSTGYVRKVASGRVIRIAGNGERRLAGDGGPASNAALSYVWGVEVTPDGNVVVADTGNGRIRRIDTNGLISTIGGTGSNFGGGDGGPATMATIHDPIDFAFDATGNLYVSDSRQVRKIDSNGTISTVAGNGPYVYNGDNIPATQASLQGPAGLAFDSASNLYIADTWGSRIRKVDPSGIITTVAGTGEWGYSGDGGPATDARLGLPWGLAIDALDNLYVSDRYHNVIRKVDTSGRISTFAGTGAGAFQGDGGPPRFASFSAPTGLAFDQRGSLYVADCGNNRVRKIENNVVFTVAGNGESRLSGDGGPAVSASLPSPTDVAIFPDGRLLITSEHGRVRWVE